jgi:hypothetical protein
MSNKTTTYLSSIILSFVIVACSTENTPQTPTPENPLNGKVKKIATTSNSKNTMDFFYNNSGLLDSIRYTDSTSNIFTTIRYFHTGNNVVSKNYTNGITSSDSTIYYSNGSRLDSIVQYIMSSRLLKTYHYNVNTLEYFKNYLNNPTATPTNTQYVNENLTRTDYTYNTGPGALYTDTADYTYSSTINNLTTSSFGFKFDGMFEVGNYSISNSKNIATQIIRKIEMGNTVNSTVIKTRAVTDISYEFDSQNRIISDTRTTITTSNLGGGSSTQTISYAIEYY